MAKTIDALYTVTLSGLYIGSVTGAAGGEAQCLKPYSITVSMDHDMVSQHGPLSSFKRFIAEQTMKRKYPDYKALSTFQVDACTCDKPELIKNNINLLTYPALVLYVKENDLNINTDLYDDATNLRRAIKDYEEDKDGYAITEATLQKRYGEAITTKHKAARLNREIVDVETSQQMPPEPPMLKEPLKGASSAPKGKQEF